MNTSIAPVKAAVSAPRAYNAAQLQLIHKTVAKDTTKDEFDMFVEICNRANLDPFRKQIYALVFNKEKEDKRQVAFITGIDGYRSIAKRAGNYRPDENPPEIVYDPDLIDPATNPKGIVRATVTVWQYAVDGWYPIRGTAAWDEFAPVVDEWENRQKTGKKKLGKENWRTMSEVMISKCAEAQALRRGWPEETSGINTWDEFDRTLVDVTASEAIEAYEQEERIKKIGGSCSYAMIFEMTEGITTVPAGELFDRVIKHVRQFETAEDIGYWMEMNRHGLQQFWARQKSDALALKTEIEAIQKEKSAIKECS